MRIGFNDSGQLQGVADSLRRVPALLADTGQNRSQLCPQTGVGFVHCRGFCIALCRNFRHLPCPDSKQCPIQKGQCRIAVFGLAVVFAKMMLNQPAEMLTAPRKECRQFLFNHVIFEHIPQMLLQGGELCGLQGCKVGMTDVSGLVVAVALGKGQQICTAIQRQCRKIDYFSVSIRIFATNINRHAVPVSQNRRHQRQ